MEGLGHAFLLGADATVTALTVNTSRRGGHSQAPHACLRASGWWEAHGGPSSVPPPPLGFTAEQLPAERGYLSLFMRALAFTSRNCTVHLWEGQRMREAWSQPPAHWWNRLSGGCAHTSANSESVGSPGHCLAQPCWAWRPCRCWPGAPSRVQQRPHWQAALNLTVLSVRISWRGF